MLSCIFLIIFSLPVVLIFLSLKYYKYSIMKFIWIHHTKGCTFETIEEGKRKRKEREIFNVGFGYYAILNNEVIRLDLNCLDTKFKPVFDKKKQVVSIKYGDEILYILLRCTIKEA